MLKFEYNKVILDDNSSLEVMNLTIFQVKRAEKNLTLKQVADASHVSESYCSLIERGVCVPSVKAAKRIAEVLGFDWTLFFEEADKE